MADMKLPDDTPAAYPAELMAVPRLAALVGVSPRVVRYWEEQGLISPTREHGKLRYSPRDVAMARLTKRLLDAGVGIEGIRVLKELAEREVRHAAETGDETLLVEIALRSLHQRKAFREVTGMDEEEFPEGKRLPAGGPRPSPPRPRSRPPRAAAEGPPGFH